MDFVCPRPAALLTINRVTCLESLGQIQRTGIIRLGGFTFDPGADPVRPITALATWTPLLTAVASTKLVLTPYHENFIIPEAEPITDGGGNNETIDGVERVLGAGPITVTSRFSGVPASIITQIRDLMGEPVLEGYFFNQYGKIICRDTTPDTEDPADKVYSGIPIYSLYVPYPGNNGYATIDQATFRFALAEDWALNRAIVTPDFNVKTQLLAPLPA